MSVTLRALVICDLAFQQAGSGSWHVIGIHDQILVTALPATHAPFVVYWSVGGFTGEAMVMCTIRDNEGAIVHATRALIPKLPVDGMEFAFAFPPITFKKEGSHSLELEVGAEIVGLRSFRVRVVAAPATA